MTQPSLNQTFDTSLIDLGSQRQTMDSFSTSSTVPDNAEPRVPALSASPGPQPNTDFTNTRGIPTHYLPTATAYDEWASVYDTDGNILQATDDLELQTLLPGLRRVITERAGTQSTLRLIDLGCGTGRNTSKLLQMHWPVPQIRITGFDVSRGMLNIAQTKLDAARQSIGNPPDISYELIQHDFLNEADIEGPPRFPRGPEEGARADALISTLVLEHLPLQPFFKIIRGLLKVGGVALVTNMHEEMGRVSQAGFERRDEGTGEVVKVRGCSWAHGVGETVDAAKAEGLEVIGSVKETKVSHEMVETGLVSQRGRKWIGKYIWYGMVLMRTS